MWTFQLELFALRTLNFHSSHFKVSLVKMCKPPNTEALGLRPPFVSGMIRYLMTSNNMESFCEQETPADPTSYWSVSGLWTMTTLAMSFLSRRNVFHSSKISGAESIPFPVNSLRRKRFAFGDEALTKDVARMLIQGGLWPCTVMRCHDNIVRGQLEKRSHSMSGLIQKKPQQLHSGWGQKRTCIHTVHASKRFNQGKEFKSTLQPPFGETETAKNCAGLKRTTDCLTVSFSLLVFSEKIFSFRRCTKHGLRHCMFYQTRCLRKTLEMSQTF